MTPLVKDFADVFLPPMALPPARHIDHWIHLILESTLPNAPTYQFPPTETKEMEKQLTKLINSGHIQPSSSPCASAAFFIPKQDTTDMHIITDYWALNKDTVKKCYPLP